MPITRTAKRRKLNEDQKIITLPIEPKDQFKQLPNELLLDLFEFFDNETLLNLSRVDHRFYGIVSSPRINKRFQLTIDYNDYKQIPTAENVRKSIAIIASGRQFESVLVKNLQIKDIFHLLMMLENSKKSIRQFHIVNWQIRWCDVLDIISLLPNLETMICDCNKITLHSQNMAPFPKNLPNIKHLVILGRYKNNYIELFAGLKTLQTLEASYISDNIMSIFDLTHLKNLILKNLYGRINLNLECTPKFQLQRLVLHPIDREYLMENIMGFLTLQEQLIELDLGIGNINNKGIDYILGCKFLKIVRISLNQLEAVNENMFRSSNTTVKELELKVDSHLLNKWTLPLVGRFVNIFHCLKILKLDLREYDGPLVNPMKFLKLKMLETIEIKVFGNLEIFKELSYKQLKKLSVSYSKASAIDWRKLCRKCPNIEELEIRYQQTDINQIMPILTKGLKKLRCLIMEFDSGTDSSNPDANTLRTIVVNAKALKFLKIDCIFGIGKATAWKKLILEFPLVAKRIKHDIVFESRW